MTVPDFERIARDMFTDACGDVSHVEIEVALMGAYNAGLERAAEIADAHQASADHKFDERVRRARRGEKNLDLAAARK